MGLIITSVVLTIITIILLGVRVDITNEKVSFKASPRMLIGLVWLFLIGFGCFTKIGTNRVGILYDPIKGGIQNYTLGQGYKTKSPLATVYKINTEIQELTFENISVQTNDAQYVNAIIKVQAKIDSNNAFEYFSRYRDKSLEDISSILSSTIQKQLETVTTQYNIMDVLGAKRNDIVNETLTLIQNELSKDGITISRITLVDTDAGAKIEDAIANEAVAKKEAETAEYKKQQAELEGEAKVITAQKEKEANDLISKTLTDEILLEKFIEKWNGQLPTTYAGEDVLGMFKIN